MSQCRVLGIGAKERILVECGNNTHFWCKRRTPLVPPFPDPSYYWMVLDKGADRKSLKKLSIEVIPRRHHGTNSMFTLNKASKVTKISLLVGNVTFVTGKCAAEIWPR